MIMISSDHFKLNGVQLNLPGLKYHNVQQTTAKFTWFEVSQCLANCLCIITAPRGVSDSSPCSRQVDFYSTFPWIRSSHKLNISCVILSICARNILPLIQLSKYAHKDLKSYFRLCFYSLLISSTLKIKTSLNIVLFLKTWSLSL